MLKKRPTMAIAATATAATIGCLWLAPILPASGAPEGATVRSQSTTILSATDADLINAVGSLLSTRAGSTVSVVRGGGRAVWSAVAADAYSIDNTPEVMTHNFLLVTCTDNVAQGGYHSLSGSNTPVIAEVQLVLDEVNGRVLEITRIPQGQANPYASAGAVSSLGEPTTMQLSGASFG